MVGNSLRSTEEGVCDLEMSFIPFVFFARGGGVGREEVVAS